MSSKEEQLQRSTPKVKVANPDLFKMKLKRTKSMPVYRDIIIRNVKSFKCNLLYDIHTEIFIFAVPQSQSYEEWIDKYHTQIVQALHQLKEMDGRE